MKSWTKEQWEFLADNYCKLTRQELGNRLGCNERHIEYCAATKGLRKGSGCWGRKSTIPINEDFFRTWSQPMAYILGLLTADGWMTTEGRNRLGISLIVPDIAAVEYIKNHIAPTQKIVIRTFSKKEFNRQDCAFWTISSRRLNDSLLDLGLCPRKTGKEVVPDIPDMYKSHYLRGLFDGDGCIYRNDRLRFNKYRSIEYRYQIASMSFNFLDQVNKKLCFGLGTVIKCKTCHDLRIQKRADVNFLGDFMYKDYEFCFERKRKVFQQLKKDFNYD